MHAFTPDGKHLLFIDAFGLTRVTLPSKLKTDRNATGAWLCQNGPLVLAHTVRQNERRLFDAVSLKRSAQSLYLWDPAALHPDGEHLVIIGSGDELLKVKNFQGTEINCPSLTAAQESGRVNLGPTIEPPPPSPRQVLVGPDGALAFLDPHHGKLFVGALPHAAAPLEDLRAYAIGVPRGSIQLNPRRTGTFVCAYHPAERRAYCALILPDGVVEERAVDCLGHVEFTGQAIVYQRDERTIVREPFAGGAEELFSLPEGAGVGEVMANADVVCFVTADRGRLLNLTAKKEALRKPEASAAETYAFVSRVLARHAPAAAEAGMTITLTDLSPPRWGGGSRPALAWDFGDGGPLPLLVIGNLIWELWYTEGGRYMLGSYNNATDIRPVSAGEMTRILGVLEKNGLSLMRGLDYLAHPFAQCFDSRWSSEKNPRLPLKALMDREAAHLVLWAALESVREGRDVPVSGAASELLERELTPEIVMEHFVPGAGSPDWDGFNRAQTALAYLLLFYFRDASLPIFIDWLLTRPSSFARANPHILSVPAARLAQMSPAAHKALLSACEHETQSGDSTRAAQGEAVRSSLAFNMR